MHESAAGGSIPLSIKNRSAPSLLSSAPSGSKRPPGASRPLVMRNARGESPAYPNMSMYDWKRRRDPPPSTSRSGIGAVPAACVSHQPAHACRWSIFGVMQSSDSPLSTPAARRSSTASRNWPSLILSCSLASAAMQPISRSCGRPRLIVLNRLSHPRTTLRVSAPSGSCPAGPATCLSHTGTLSGCLGTSPGYFSRLAPTMWAAPGEGLQ